MDKAFIAALTWEEFRDAVNSKTVIVVPVGSTELEGPHLPLGVDTIMADGVASKLAGEPGVLISPTLPIGYSKWFHPFPGTISLEHDTLTRVFLEYCTCLINHGVKRIVFVNSHRGNNTCIEVAAHTLIKERKVRIGMLSIWKLANDLTSRESGMIREGKFTHGGEIMTSSIMALEPETVVIDKIAPESVKSPVESLFEVKNSLGDTAFKGCIQTVYQDIRDVTETGVMGDPTAASADKGESILDLVTDYARAFIQEFRNLTVESY
ncbi:MAG: creatininase family protein [Desulfobacterales bacterium]|jgi:creatinine amidohydrolase